MGAPIAADGRWRCEVRLPDGTRAAGDGAEGDDALAAAIGAAEEALDAVEQASRESFPASDSPGYSGPGI